MQVTRKQFASVAREFVVWTEAEPKSETNEATFAIRILARLYYAGLFLPQTECGADIEGFGVSEDEWKKAYLRFASLPFNYYFNFFSPADLSDIEPGTGDLADDLADIYRDLKEGLNLFDLGHEIEAVWEWKYSFQSHWGRHAASALHALHAFAADNDLTL